MFDPSIPAIDKSIFDLYSDWKVVYDDVKEDNTGHMLKLRA